MKNPTFPNLNSQEVQLLTLEKIRQLTARANINRVCENRGCNARLTEAQNFRNVFCWNCLYKMAKQRGNSLQAQEIADMYL